MTIFLACVLFFPCVFGELQNAALRKPARQSSVYRGVDGYDYEAGWAVDGNNNTVFSGRSCSCTLYSIGWWQVDLGDNFVIVKVKVTNRETSGQRLSDFDIMVSNSTSMAASDICVRYVGAVTSGETETIMCNNITKGRYLRIRKKNADYLTLCEVEVMVLKRTKRKFYCQAKTKVISSNTTLSVSHRVQCGQICLQNSVCVGFNYQEGSQTCQLLPSTNDPVMDEDWWMYSLMTV